MRISTLLLPLALTATLSVQAQKLKWAIQNESTNATSFSGGPKLNIDASGNIIVAASFIGQFDVDPGTSVLQLTATGGSSGYDTYLQKLDAQRNLVWARMFDGSDYCGIQQIESDGAGNIYLAGVYKSSMDADPNTGTQMLNATTSNGEDHFLIKLNAAGQLVWAKNETFFTGMAVDGANNLWVGIDTTFGMKVKQYNATGIQTDKYIWQNFTAGTTMHGKPAFDKSGTLYIYGSFTGMFDTDPGPGVYNISSSSWKGDGYVIRMTASGSAYWAREFLSLTFNAENEIKKLHFDAGNNVYIQGHFYESIDLDPTAGIYSDTIYNSRAADFIVKLKSNGDFDWARTYDINNSAAYDVVQNIAVDAPGNVYVAGGTNINIDLNRKRNPPVKLAASGSQDPILMKLNTNGQISLIKQMGSAASKSSIIDDIALNAQQEVITTGFYRISLKTDIADAASPVLTSIGQSQNAFISGYEFSCSIDTSITRAGNILTANAGNVSYQWKDCATGQNIPGANQSSYTPTKNGSYRLVLNNGQCTDSSSCYVITGLSVGNQSVLQEATAYPNPTDGMVRIDLNKQYAQVTIEIRNALGQLISLQDYAQAQQITTPLGTAPGLYFIRISADGQHVAQLHVIRQ